MSERHTKQARLVTRCQDMSELSLEELDELIDQLVDEELEISQGRRAVHARLEALWAERERRRRPADAAS